MKERKKEREKPLARLLTHLHDTRLHKLAIHGLFVQEHLVAFDLLHQALVEFPSLVDLGPERGLLHRGVSLALNKVLVEGEDLLSEVAVLLFLCSQCSCLGSIVFGDLLLDGWGDRFYCWLSVGLLAV